MIVFVSAKRLVQSIEKPRLYRLLNNNNE